MKGKKHQNVYLSLAVTATNHEYFDFIVTPSLHARWSKERGE